MQSLIRFPIIGLIFAQNKLAMQVFDKQRYDAIIIGGGAAGLMCAIEAGKRQRRVLILDHSNKPGKKILMSGGGRCNFTNKTVTHAHFISHNPHFCKSALNRYTPDDFIELVQRYQIPHHEKTLGQLFCDHKSKAILDMLLRECARYSVNIELNHKIERIDKPNSDHMLIVANGRRYTCDALVIATGGLSIPTLGASPYGYQVASQFGLSVHPTRAALVPLTCHVEDKERLAVLSGISLPCRVTAATGTTFQENLLFTHRGLSGPAILQISSYWQPGQALSLDLCPDAALFDQLKSAQRTHPTLALKTWLHDYFPKKMLAVFLPPSLADTRLLALNESQIQSISNTFHAWQIVPNGTEGYRTAEVTLGGVDCDALSSKTMQVHTVPGLYFIGEVVDVTGWLGGYNFQWAWSSGWAAGQVV